MKKMPSHERPRISRAEYTGQNTTVDPAWYPCHEGQIKGNNTSKIYHVPTGRSYNKTFKDVTCFTTAAEAEAAGFRAAKN